MSERKTASTGPKRFKAKPPDGDCCKGDRLAAIRGRWMRGASRRSRLVARTADTGGRWSK